MSEFEEKPSLVFEAYSDDVSGDWDVSAELRLFLARGAAAKLIGEIVGDLAESIGNDLLDVSVPGTVSLTWDDAGRPTALHHDGGLLQRAWEEAEAEDAAESTDAAGPSHFKTCACCRRSYALDEFLALAPPEGGSSMRSTASVWLLYRQCAAPCKNTMAVEVRTK